MKKYNFQNGNRSKVRCPYCNEEVYEATSKRSKGKPNIGHLRICKPYLEIKNKLQKELTNQKLIQLYINKGFSANKIANILNKEYNITTLDAAFIINLLKKYNIKCRTIKQSSQMLDRKELTKQTCLQRYGDTNCLGKNSPLYQKRNQTVRQRYGVNNVFQLEETKQKIKQYNLEHYGVQNRMLVKQIRNKQIKKCEEKYGVKYPVLIRRSISLPHKIVSDYLKSININFINEYYLKEEVLYLDIYLPDYNVVIQVYGDFFHANPRKYKQGDILNFPHTHSKLVKDIWEHDEKRIKKIENILHPNKILIFWQYDIHNNFNLIQEEIQNIIK